MKPPAFLVLSPVPTYPVFLLRPISAMPNWPPRLSLHRTLSSPFPSEDPSAPVGPRVLLSVGLTYPLASKRAGLRFSEKCLPTFPWSLCPSVPGFCQLSLYLSSGKWLVRPVSLLCFRASPWRRASIGLVCVAIFLPFGSLRSCLGLRLLVCVGGDSRDLNGYSPS